MIWMTADGVYVDGVRMGEPLNLEDRGMARKWEYRVTELLGHDREAITDWLNDRDMDGWELFSVVQGWGVFRRPFKGVEEASTPLHEAPYGLGVPVTGGAPAAQGQRISQIERAVAELIAAGINEDLAERARRLQSAADYIGWNRTSPRDR